MEPETSDSRRLLQIEIQAQKDIILRSVSVVEAISRPFRARASIVTKYIQIVPAEIIGKEVSIKIYNFGLELRKTFSGIISSISDGDVLDYRRDGDAEFYAYDIEVVPCMAKLAWQSNCRVFQDVSVTDIVAKLASDIDTERPSIGSTPTEPRPYCIQFNENDYDFMQRILDSLGCGYYWEYETCDMKIAHSAGDYLTLPGMPANGYLRDILKLPATLTGWSSRRLIDSGKTTALDFDLKRPSALLRQSETTLLTELQNQIKHERFAWPGGQFLQPEQHGHPARLTIERIEAATETARAYGLDPAMTPGYKIRVRKTPEDADAQEWLILSVAHTAFDETFITEGGGAAYSNAITVQPALRPFRPQQVLAKPVVPGVQSAIVVGPSDQEIHTDDLGRIKIRFLWDRFSETDDRGCSIWVRVAQPVAGKWGGTFFLPRVGDEVLVAFTDGDPDKPVVIGSLYNEESPLDAEHFKRDSANPMSGLRTRSTKEGRSDNGHVIRFNDTKSTEELYIQSERDLKLLVKNGRTETINAGDLSGDDTYLIAHGNRNITIAEGNYTLEVKKGNLVEDVDQGNHNLTVKTGNETVKVDQGNYALTVSQGDATFDIKLGDFSITCGAGAITIEAMQSITLKCGGSVLKLDQSGISLNGVMVKIEGSASATLQSPMTTAGGSGMTSVTGAAIMIG